VIDLPPFDALALSLHHSPGVHAILVGSGLSRAAGIPTGWEITVDLIRRLAALDSVAEHDDWVQWYRDKYSEEPSYSEILGSLASTSAERRAILQSYIDPPEGEDVRKPTKAHHTIAQLVASGAVRVVITTNFDRLVENALREAGVEPTVIASDDAGPVAIDVGIDWRVFGRHEAIRSCGEVNDLIVWFLGEGLPSVDLAHGDLP
jgi:hypothetical protein